MHDTPRSGWRQWRLCLAQQPDSSTLINRFNRSAFQTNALAHLKAEVAGADGIRHALVARIREEIEAGTYDTEERWLAAENLILQRYANAV